MKWLTRKQSASGQPAWGCRERSLIVCYRVSV